MITRAVSQGPHPPPQNMAAHQALLPPSLLRIFTASGDSFLQSLLDCTSPIACWAALDVCGLERLGDLKHKLWVQILTVSLVPRYSPCLTCTFHRGCLGIAYCISPRDCCFVNFLHYCFGWICITRSFKKNSTLFSAFFFKYIFIPPSQSPEASSSSS